MSNKTIQYGTTILLTDGARNVLPGHGGCLMGAAEWSDILIKQSINYF